MLTSFADTATSASSQSGTFITINSAAVKPLMTVLRDTDLSHADFVRTSDRLMRLLAEEALAYIPTMLEICVRTPVKRSDGSNHTYVGRQALYSHNDDTKTQLCVVSVMRSGDAMLSAFHDIVPEAGVGKILIQRDDAHGSVPVLFYGKFPHTIASSQVILADPMLATGGSACMAIDVLMKHGVPEEHILFVCVIACPQGIARVHKEHPRVKIIAAAVDQGLNEHNYIVPGLGDFGDRYFDT